MPDLNIVGTIIQKRAEDLTDDAIKELLKAKGWVIEEIEKAFSAIEADLIYEAHSLAAFTPLSPVTYRLGVRKIEKETRILHGLMKTTNQVAIRTIDEVKIEKNLISATVIIVHTNDSELHIRNISREDAEKIRKVYSDVIEAQRKKIINIAQD